MSSVILKHNQYVFYDLRSSAKLKEMLDGWNFDGVPPSSELVSQVLHHIIKCAVLISLWEWSSLFSTFPQILEYTVFVNQDGHQDAFMASSLNKFLGILMNNQSFQSQQIFEHRIHPSIFQTIYPIEDQRLNTESWRISILAYIYYIYSRSFSFILCIDDLSKVHHSVVLLLNTSRGIATIFTFIHSFGKFSFYFKNFTPGFTYKAKD